MVAGSDTKSIPIEAEDDPHKIAREGLSKIDPLKYWRGFIYQYDGRKYQEQSKAEFPCLVTNLVRREFEELWQRKYARWVANGKVDSPPKVKKITRGIIDNVKRVILADSLVESQITPPYWLNGWRGDYIAAENCIVDIHKLIRGDDPKIEHSHEFFSLNCLDYSFNPDATCKRWTESLNRALDGDQERIDILQEWFGLMLIPDLSFQKFMMFYGDGATGKSTVCAVLIAMLGQANVSNVPLELFGERFGLWNTFGKMANIAAEVGDIGRVAEGVLKSFTSGDSMMWDRKHHDQFSAPPTARLTLATNNLPRFSDKSGGLWRRMILMPFDRVIPPAERVRGMDKPEWWIDSGEMPGVFNWSIEGLKRLRQNERFTTSSECDRLLNQYQSESNPAGMFLKENYREQPNGQPIITQEIYNQYKCWCSDRGHKALAASKFGREIQRAFPAVKRVQTKDFDNNRKWAYSGICEGGQ